MLTRRGSGSHAESSRSAPGSEAIPLPVASQEIISKLVSAIGRLEDPKTGNVALGIQLILPPLTPGGVDFLTALAAWATRLGPAIATGRVVIISETYAANVRQALADHGMDAGAGWLEAIVGSNLQLLASIVGGALTAEELGELTVSLGAESPTLRTIKQLHGGETAAEHLRNALQILQPAILDYAARGDDPSALWSIEQVGHDVAAAVVRINQALAQLEPAPDTGAPARVAGSLALVDDDGDGDEQRGEDDGDIHGQQADGRRK